MLNVKTVYINSNDKVFTIKHRAALNYYRFMLIHIHSQQYVLARNLKKWKMTGRTLETVNYVKQSALYGTL